MDRIVLAAKTREVLGKSVAGLRAEALTPAVIYGHGETSSSISVLTKDLTQAYTVAGGNKIIGLKIGASAEKNVIIHDVQHNVLTGELTHADFYVVRMDEKLTTDVPLHFVGESTAVYQLEGSLLKSMESVEIEALPADLPDSIEVDISVLDDFEKAIHVSDLVVPKGVEIQNDPSELIARVEEPRSEEELAELDAQVTQVLPEGVAEDAPETEDKPASGK
jgi:large subunit ribosomal protein L25